MLCYPNYVNLLFAFGKQPEYLHGVCSSALAYLVAAAPKGYRILIHEVAAHSADPDEILIAGVKRRRVIASLIIVDKAHAGVCPENGIHALKAAACAAANIPVGHVDDISVQNISNFVSEGPTNIVADKASFDMEFRSYDEDTVQKHIADALAVMKEACEKFGTTFEYDSERHSGAFTVDPESQFIKDIFAAYEAAGIRPYLSKTLGGCDASNIALHDIAVVNIGTGMRDVHTTAENISIKDMENSTRFLCELLKA